MMSEWPKSDCVSGIWFLVSSGQLDQGIGKVIWSCQLFPEIEAHGIMHSRFKFRQFFLRIIFPWFYFLIEYVILSEPLDEEEFREAWKYRGFTFSLE